MAAADGATHRSAVASPGLEADDASAVLASDRARMPAVRFLSVWSLDGLK
jgi:hypothetical protein